MDNEVYEIHLSAKEKTEFWILITGLIVGALSCFLLSFAAFNPSSDVNFVSLTITSLCVCVGIAYFIWRAKQEEWLGARFLVNECEMIKKYPSGKTQAGLWSNLEKVNRFRKKLYFKDGTVIYFGYVVNIGIYGRELETVAHMSGKNSAFSRVFLKE